MDQRVSCAAALFRAHHERLRHTVRHVVATSDAVIEDACAFAWLRLARSLLTSPAPSERT